MSRYFRLVCLGCLFFIFNGTKVIADNEVLEVEISIKDHKFEPEQIVLPTGKKIRLTVYNRDSTIEEFDSIDLKREKIIPGNSYVHIILAPLKPGKYCFVGEFHAETAKGCIIIN